ncbi:E3 ubiquitin-protein ligase ATL42-like [Phoenix dactylifera]|uniref:RING-type E3 ubiquitin transferase n=1 Tax=Phoenix dactylifera TaxID=42345 RepID=A0A8B7CL79_PHODC|nr:E3 ubiquitin-protein ligase ATL42-like [Phoenix dactylifera]
MRPPNPSLRLLVFFSIWAIGTAETSQPDSEGVTVSFRPSVAIVIGVFSLMFSLTFLLLVYAKFCHTAASELFSSDPGRVDRPNGHILSDNNRFSGIDKTVIESLPFFRFSSLRGARAGLECAVCLSRFDDTELLRLLPKCKHAFHLGCVDRWLEAHSSCPLCRCKVSVEDATLFKYSTSSRFLFPSSRREDPAKDLELALFVEREPGDNSGRHGSSRFSVGSSFRRMERKEKPNLPILEERNHDGGEFYHKFKHRIIVSDVVFRSRWSDVNSSDFISLNTDMLSLASSKRFSSLDSDLNSYSESIPNEKRSADRSVLKIKEEIEKKRLLESKASQMNRDQSAAVGSASDGEGNSGTAGSRALVSSGNNRSMSEITNLSRFRAVSEPAGFKEEKVRRLWLPIARRTVQWFAGRETRSQSQGIQEETSV